MSEIVPCKKRRYERRKEKKKTRRRKIRQSLARLRDEKISEEQERLEAFPSHLEHLKNLVELEAIAEEKEIAANERENQLWIEREQIAQKEWRQKRKENEERRKSRELKENAIRAEWESLKQKEELKKLERESILAEEKRLQVKSSQQHYFLIHFIRNHIGILVGAT